MTKAFDSLIQKSAILLEDTPDTPASSGSDTLPTPENAKWLKEVNTKLQGYYDYINPKLIQSLYGVSIGYIGQKSVDLNYYAIQDLLRLLYACPSINPTPNQRNPIPWDRFVGLVEQKQDSPDVDNVLTRWNAQVGQGKEPAEYVIQDPLLARNYELKRKDKETAMKASLSVYYKDTLYNGIIGMIEKRISPLQRFEGVISKKIGNLSQYEQILLEILRKPANASSSITKLPKEFTDQADIEPRTLISISLACEMFFKSEIPRIISLAVERKVRENKPWSNLTLTPGQDTQPELGEPMRSVGGKEVQGELDLQPSGGPRQTELDLSSLQGSKDEYLFDFIPFEKFAKTKDYLAESNLWGKIQTFVKNQGKKAVQTIWVGTKKFIQSKKIPFDVPEYENFLKTGAIKTKVKIPNNLLTPDITPVFDVEIEIDSTKERINNAPVIYTIGLIEKLSAAGGATEAKNLISLLQNFAEHPMSETSKSTYLDKAGASFAAATT